MCCKVFIFIRRLNLSSLNLPTDKFLHKGPYVSKPAAIPMDTLQSLDSWGRGLKGMVVMVLELRVKLKSSMQ